jgi:hypothetical protein
MSRRLAELAARRRALVAQSDALREQASVSARGLRQLLGFVDLGVAAGRSMAGKPLVAVAIAAALMLLRPRRPLRLLGFALTAISIIGHLRQILGLLSAARR